MKLHPNYIRALEDKYSDTSFEKDILYWKISTTLSISFRKNYILVK